MLAPVSTVVVAGLPVTFVVTSALLFPVVGPLWLLMVARLAP